MDFGREFERLVLEEFDCEAVDFEAVRFLEDLLFDMNDSYYGLVKMINFI